MKWFHTTSLFEKPPFSIKTPNTPTANRELSVSILPLLEKITPECVNEYVELVPPVSRSSEEDNTPNVYKFKSHIYNTVHRKSSRRVRIEEEFIPNVNTDYSLLDNFEKSLAEYWDNISFDLERNLDDISIYCDAYQPYCNILNQCIKVIRSVCGLIFIIIVVLLLSNRFWITPPVPLRNGDLISLDIISNSLNRKKSVWTEW